jgi:hypothetical protein
MAIIPTNNDSEAKAAASWIRALNIDFTASLPQNRERT